MLESNTRDSWGMGSKGLGLEKRQVQGVVVTWRRKGDGTGGRVNGLERESTVLNAVLIGLSSKASFWKRGLEEIWLGLVWDMWWNTLWLLGCKVNLRAVTGKAGFPVGMEDSQGLPGFHFRFHRLCVMSVSVSPLWDSTDETDVSLSHCSCYWVYLYFSFWI